MENSTDDSRGNCKNMDGSRDGSKETEKDLSTTMVDTGKLENNGIGKHARTYLAR